MEKIIIKDFSVLNDIELEINRINIFIGKEATGKSLISKLIYFFKGYITDLLLAHSDKSHNISTFQNALKKGFKAIFPAYFWENQNFNIKYFYPNEDVYISLSKAETPAPQIKIILSEKFREKYKEISNEFASANFLDIRTPAKIKKRIEKKLFGQSYQTDFIPSSRSFFSQIQSSIFTMGLLNVRLDFFTQKFGADLEIIKRNYPNIELDKEIKEISKEILKGVYYFDGKEEWIYNDDKKTLLKDSSSGQQEIAPILVWLSVITVSEKDAKHLFIIEEPETHLFPTSQKRIIELLAIFYNTKKTNFIVTTHSPYIITVFNNLIQAHNTSTNADTSKIANVISRNKWISFDDISAYLVKDGKLTDLKDYENQLLTSDAIDEVSDEISEEFNNLIDFEYE